MKIVNYQVMRRKTNKLFLFAMLTLTSLASIAQQGGTYDVYDSSVISRKHIGQQNEFWNNTYSFPSKPRNQFEIGLSGGAFTVTGDVRAKFPTPGGTIHIRKALGYLFSLRLQYLYGIGKGQNYLGSSNFKNNPAWAQYSTGNIVFYNYKASEQDLSLQGIFSLNNIRFHKQKNSFLIYLGAGLGSTIYHTTVNANNNGQPYTTLFNGISRSSQTYENRKDVLDALKNGLDDSYETEAESQQTRHPTIGDNTLKASGTFLGGIAFKLSRKLNLAIEDRFTIVKDDLLDGQQWQEHPGTDPALSPENDAYNYVSIGLNFNLGANSVEPLYWINPLDYAYSELNSPRHMKLPKPVLDDTDDDGVINQLDKEPNSPAGCAVDTHGVTRDTDGDGVPDCKDKQLITPTECQPVDTDGVGKCPEPPCCTDSTRSGTGTGACDIGDLPSISFRGNTGSLNSNAKAMLANVASKLKVSADCNITITGYPAASKTSQALCNKRIEAVRINLMEDQGISGDRITTNCEVGGGDANTVDIKTLSR